MAMTLASVLAASSILGACQGTKENEASSPSPSAAASASTGATAPAAEKNFDKQIKLSMYNAGGFNPTSLLPAREEDPLRQKLEKAVNVELSVTIPTADQRAAKLNTMIASGDIPDMLFMWDKNVAADYYSQGVIMELDPYLADYPNLKKRFPEGSWEAMKINGKTVMTPGFEGVSGVKGWWIRNDWLQKLNLKVPATPDELLEVLKAFTFNDPDGNGKNDTYGFVAGVGKDGELAALNWEMIFWMYGIQPNTPDIIDGKLVFGSTDPRMKEAIAFIQKMIEAKVVDPDWVSINDSAAINKKMYAGKAGFIPNDWRRMEPGDQTQMKEVGGEVPDWIIVAPAKGPHGDQRIGVKNHPGNGWAISVNAAKDKEKVKRILALLDYWYGDAQAYPYFAYGIEGTQWQMVNGKPEKLAPTKEQEEKLKWTANWFLPRRVDDAVYFNFKNPKTAEFQQINLKYIKENPIVPKLVLNPDDTLFNDRKKYINETLLKFMIGKEPLSNWDAYVEILNTKFEYKKYTDDVTAQVKKMGLLP
jgi:putative aldouronate transport system substrate-binding protein